MDLAELGPIAKEYEVVKAKRLAADKTAKALKVEEDTLKQQIITTCRENGGSGVHLADVRIEYNSKDVPKASDWSAIQEYIRENDAIDLMQKRLHEGACKARWEDGVEIPGVYKDPYESIKVEIL